MNINSNFDRFTQNYSTPSSQDLLTQLAAQNQVVNQSQGYGLQGPGQDALLSISQAGSGGDPRALGEQLEQQVSGGDLQGALSTLQQLQANRPSGGNKPPGAEQIESLQATLAQQLQNQDQEGAEQTLSQIQSTMQSNRPQPPQQQSQGVDQVAGLGQPTPLSNGQYPGSKQFQRSSSSDVQQRQQLRPPFQFNVNG